MSKFTILFLLFSVISCIFGAPANLRPQNVPLSPEAQKIADALKSLLKAETVSKIVQIFAAQGPNSKAYIDSLGNITPEAANCLSSQIMPITMRNPPLTSIEEVKNAYVEACPDYRTQIEPMFTALEGAMKELNATMQDNSDLPQSYQTFMEDYTKLAKEIQANPNATENGPKLQALLDEFKSIPEADSEILAQKLPFYKDLILPSGQAHRDVISLWESQISKFNGQQVDETAMKETAQRVLAYLVQNLDQLLAYFKTEIENYQLPAEIVNDEAVTKYANAFGKAVEYYSNILFNVSWFNAGLNAIVGGKTDNSFTNNNAIAA